MLPTMIGGQKSRYPVTNPYLAKLPGAGKGANLSLGVPLMQKQIIVKQGTKAPPQTQTPQQQFIAQTTKSNPYDVSGDPILQRVLGNNVRSLADAQTLKTEQQKKLLLGFGSSELAKKMFGGEQSFVDSVAGNPFSVLGQIAHQYEGRGGQINQANEGLNQRNLFYSSERTGNVLPELFRQRQSSEYDATQNVQNALDQVSQAYVNTQNQTQSDEISAQQDAASRATQAALQSGYGPGASGGLSPGMGYGTPTAPPSLFAPSQNMGPAIMPRAGAPSISDAMRFLR